MGRLLRGIGGGLRGILLLGKLLRGILLLRLLRGILLLLRRILLLGRLLRGVLLLGRLLRGILLLGRESRGLGESGLGLLRGILLLLGIGSRLLRRVLLLGRESLLLGRVAWLLGLRGVGGLLRRVLLRGIGGLLGILLLGGVGRGLRVGGLWLGRNHSENGGSDGRCDCADCRNCWQALDDEALDVLGLEHVYEPNSSLSPLSSLVLMYVSAVVMVVGHRLKFPLLSKENRSNASVPSGDSVHILHAIIRVEHGQRSAATGGPNHVRSSGSQGIYVGVVVVLKHLLEGLYEFNDGRNQGKEEDKDEQSCTWDIRSNYEQKDEPENHENNSRNDVSGSGDAEGDVRPDHGLVQVQQCVVD